MHNTYLPVCEFILSVEAENRKGKKQYPATHTKNIIDNMEKQPLNSSPSIVFGLLLIYSIFQTLFENGFVLKREESYTVLMLDTLIISIIIINGVPIIL